jgi:hypothetical protein
MRNLNEHLIFDRKYIEISEYLPFAKQISHISQGPSGDVIIDDNIIHVKRDHE